MSMDQTYYKALKLKKASIEKSPAVKTQFIYILNKIPIKNINKHLRHLHL